MELAGQGMALARSYFGDVVAPLLAEHQPGLGYAAARVGQGSEVLGLDDATSRDHDWGLRLQVFVPDDHVLRVRHAVEEHLPAIYDGYPSRLALSGDPTERVGVEVTTVSAFAHRHLGFDPRQRMSTSDWLGLTGQSVLEVVGGAVFADGTGELTALRDALAWYPDDLWRYVVACD